MRKIEIMENAEHSWEWHWVILEWSEEQKGWYNISSGLEHSYAEACKQAKEAYQAV